MAADNQFSPFRNNFSNWPGFPVVPAGGLPEQGLGQVEEFSEAREGRGQNRPVSGPCFKSGPGSAPDCPGLKQEGKAVGTREETINFKHNLFPCRPGQGKDLKSLVKIFCMEA
jgi:hypothetical protein